MWAVYFEHANGARYKISERLTRQEAEEAVAKLNNTIRALNLNEANDSQTDEFQMEEMPFLG